MNAAASSVPAAEARPGPGAAPAAAAAQWQARGPSLIKLKTCCYFIVLLILAWNCKDFC